MTEHGTNRRRFPLSSGLAGQRLHLVSSAAYHSHRASGPRMPSFRLVAGLAASLPLEPAPGLSDDLASDK